MRDNTQPEAGSTHIIRYALEMGLLWIDGDGRDKVREALDALDTLEAQLEAIGAGGVSGPLLGRAMDHFRDATKMMGRWYMVTHDGMATLCADREDAEKEAKDADMAWPHSGPHRAVQLVEASTAGFTAADMATASAQGFRDGVASLAASAGEPVACGNCGGTGWMVRDPDIGTDQECFVCEGSGSYPEAAPPTAQAEGWRLVPLEPTVAQREAMRKGTGMSFSETKIAYAAMIAAAPKAAPGDALDEAMRERDDAEDFINELLDEVLGADRPEWSSAYNRYDAMSDVQERMTALHKPAVDKA